MSLYRRRIIAVALLALGAVFVSFFLGLDRFHRRMDAIEVASWERMNELSRTSETAAPAQIDFEALARDMGLKPPKSVSPKSAPAPRMEEWLNKRTSYAVARAVDFEFAGVRRLEVARWRSIATYHAVVAGTVVLVVAALLIAPLPSRRSSQLPQ